MIWLGHFLTPFNTGILFVSAGVGCRGTFITHARVTIKQIYCNCYSKFWLLFQNRPTIMLCNMKPNQIPVSAFKDRSG